MTFRDGRESVPAHAHDGEDSSGIARFIKIFKRQIIDLAHIDDTAIHDDVADEITAVTLKTVPVAADEILLEDSAASYVKKSATVGTLAGALSHASLLNLTTGDPHTQYALESALVWQAWSPTLTNITLGNGTVVARYTQIGSTVIARFLFTFGSSGSAVGTSPAVSLPVTCHASYGDNTTNVGSATLFEAGVARRAGTVIIANTTQRFNLEALDVSTTVRHIAITATVPFTWGTGDTIGFSATYEAA